MYLEKERRREKFERKHNSGPEMRSLGKSYGMKLVRVETEGVVAVYVNVTWAVRKRGKMSFFWMDPGMGWATSGGLWLL